ncbi:MAG: hypothetical protein LBU06_01960 [Desulfovibrio sp.]|jgi:hypothetical protein|nr:hypothetical protein [Desulfovibrio sp.]
MPQLGETLHSLLPQDIPWYLPDHAVFFGAFYLVLAAIGLGLLWVLVKSLRDCCGHGSH